MTYQEIVEMKNKIQALENMLKKYKKHYTFEDMITFIENDIIPIDGKLTYEIIYKLTSEGSGIPEDDQLKLLNILIKTGFDINTYPYDMEGDDIATVYKIIRDGSDLLRTALFTEWKSYITVQIDLLYMLRNSFRNSLAVSPTRLSPALLDIYRNNLDMFEYTPTDTLANEIFYLFAKHRKKYKNISELLEIIYKTPLKELIINVAISDEDALNLFLPEELKNTFLF